MLELDRLIAMKAKELEGFRRSYEHVSHRKLNFERPALSAEMNEARRQGYRGEGAQGDGDCS